MKTKSILLATALAGAMPATATAQSSPSQGDQTLPPKTANAASPETDEPEDSDESPEIVVRGARPEQRGAVTGDIAPEVQFSRSTIRALGVGSVSEVLDELAPQIRSDRGRGEAPVILVNGHRTSGFSEVRDIPAEAISRVDILPEEVALKYGFTANQHVVNIVLRKRFRAFVAEARDRLSTEGGGNTFEPMLSYTRIDGPSRINLSAQYLHSDMLTEVERDIALPIPGKPYSLAGNLTAPPGAGSTELDPALSQLAGFPVTIAGVSNGAPSVAPGLADFIPTANRPSHTDTRPYRSLLPSTEQLTLNAAATQTILHSVEATFNASLRLDRSKALSGLPGFFVVLPAGNPFSPFARDIVLYRYGDPSFARKIYSNDLDGHVGINLNSSIGKWNGTLTGSYDRTEAHTRSDAGIDASGLQAALLSDDPGVNPFATLSTLPVQSRAPDVSRADTDHGSVDLTLRGALVPLPAGPLTLSTRFGGNWETLDSFAERAGNPVEARLSRQDVNGQLSVDIPIASRRKGVLPFLGNLSVNANFAAHRLSGAKTLKTYGFGLNWTPVPAIRILASLTDEDGAPNLLQLGAPATVSTGVRTYDFVNGETVEVTQVSSGNSNLRNDNRKIIKLGAVIRPERMKGLTLTATYVHKRVHDAIASPFVSDDTFEQAFPENFVRDATGTLVRTIRAPLNLDREVQDELRWGVNFTKGSSAKGQILSGTNAANPARLQFALYHTWHLHDDVRLKPGLPTIDLLDGGTINASGGQPRHEIEAQAGILKNGIGLRASANWRSATHIAGSSPASSLHFADLATANLRFFINLGQQKSWLEQQPWLRGLRFTVSIDNLFDARPRVTDGTGHTPHSYQPDFLDPLGRTVRLSIRKVFY